MSKPTFSPYKVPHNPLCIANSTVKYPHSESPGCSSPRVAAQVNVNKLSMQSEHRNVVRESFGISLAVVCT